MAGFKAQALLGKIDVLAGNLKKNELSNDLGEPDDPRGAREGRPSAGRMLIAAIGQIRQAIAGAIDQMNSRSFGASQGFVESMRGVGLSKI